MHSFGLWNTLLFAIVYRLLHHVFRYFFFHGRNVKLTDIFIQLCCYRSNSGSCILTFFYQSFKLVHCLRGISGTCCICLCCCSKRIHFLFNGTLMFIQATDF